MALLQAGLLAALVTTGYLGGSCVYDKGMRVIALEPPPEKLGPPVWKHKLRHLARAG